jgi:ubiquinone/menaquinone biosynthesis C-methylase UbiE
MMTLYDKIGTKYSQHRCADDELGDKLFALLGLPRGSVVADVGAGTGNYSRALADRGLSVKAIEPSSTMRSQAVAHASVEFLTGTAEDVPLPTASVDGVICIFAFHHFPFPDKAVAEMNRVCSSGPILFLTFDPRQIAVPWFAEYFPTLWAASFDSYLSIADLSSLLAEHGDRTVKAIPHLLRHDVPDLFAGAGWNRPEIYLDEGIRNGMSPFALAPQSVVDAGVSGLAADLKSGRWDELNGRLRSQRQYDVGYRLVLAQ